MVLADRMVDDFFSIYCNDAYKDILALSQNHPRISFFQIEV